MTTIAAWVIHKPRRARSCEGFRHKGPRAMEAPHVRIFGRAGPEDSPYAVYLCLACARLVEAQEEERFPRARHKVRAALMTYAARNAARLNHRRQGPPRRRWE